MLSGYPGPFEARIKYKANNILAPQFMCVWRTIDNIRKIAHTMPTKHSLDGTACNLTASKVTKICAGLLVRFIEKDR